MIGERRVCQFEDLEAAGKLVAFLKQPWHARKWTRAVVKEESHAGMAGCSVAMNVSVGEAELILAEDIHDWHECKNLRAASRMPDEARPCKRRLRLQRGSKEAGTT
jgi:hypothetical protein